MRISLNWLREYLDVKPDISIEEISESLTLAGLEVEGVSSLSSFSEHLFLAQITEIRTINERESLISVIDAEGKSLLVAGPSSALLEIGMVVAYKPHKPKKKQEHQGLIATYADLGLPAGHQEIIVFNRDQFEQELPNTLAQVKEFDDVIISLGITPNRADALSHLGVSRELSALLDLNARSFMLTPREMAGFTHEKVAIEINNSEDCPRYACRVIENITVKESPYWIKLRLLLAGIRPINNVVDVTNYVMLARGQPLHAYDYDKLDTENARVKIWIKRASEGEKFIALDGVERNLSSNDVVIADREKILALAGIIGGKSSGISDGTKTVLLEAAYFDQKNVRMTARAHGISTESSYRFERGCDPNGVIDALNYAARILSDNSDAKVCRELIDAYRKRIDPQEIKMRPERAQAVLGMDAHSFDQDLLRKRFLKLGIETVAKRGDAIYFRVPTYRSDLTREIDLIEEAARMIGYDKVNSTSVGTLNESANFHNVNLEIISKKLKERLISRGFFEVVNYAFLNEEFQDNFLDPDDKPPLIRLKNPLSDRYGVMRLSLIPGLIKNLLHNQRNQEKSIRLFEIGTVFLGPREQGIKPAPFNLAGSLDQDSYCLEQQKVAGVVFGPSPYFAFDDQPREMDFYHVKGLISEMLMALGLKDHYPEQRIAYEHGTYLSSFHPGESATIKYHPGDNQEPMTLGIFGRLHPGIAAKLEILNNIYIFEFDLEKMATLWQRTVTFKAFSRYPKIERDVAFLVDEEVKVGSILQAITALKNAKDTLINLRVFDIYRGKNIASGKKSVAISFELRKDDRTLTDEEADDFMTQAIDNVKRETKAHIRS